MSRINNRDRKRTRNNRKGEDYISNLPLDILHNILSRIQAKSLLKLKTVSKSWNAIISDPVFISVHLNQSEKSDFGSVFLFKSDYRTDMDLARFDNLKLGKKTTLRFPVEEYDWGRVLCSCRGLLVSNYYQIYFVWNPSTGEYNMFWCPYRVRNRDATHGLCYDPSSGDYKMVMVCKGWYVVFSCRNNHWTNKKKFECSGISKDPGVYVDGKLYWTVIEREQGYVYGGYKGKFLEFKPGNHRTDSVYSDWQEFESDYTCSHEIVCFDPTNDDFKKFERPNGVDKDHIFYLTNLRGSLFLYQSWFDRKFLKIWTIEGDEWVNLMNIGNVPGPRFREFVKPLLLTNENEIVVFVERDNEFVVYTPKTNKFSKMRKLWDEEAAWHSGFNITYLDSLVVPFQYVRPKRKPGKVISR